MVYWFLLISQLMIEFHYLNGFVLWWLSCYYDFSCGLFLHTLLVSLLKDTFICIVNLSGDMMSSNLERIRWIMWCLWMGNMEDEKMVRRQYLWVLEICNTPSIYFLLCLLDYVEDSLCLRYSPINENILP